MKHTYLFPILALVFLCHGCKQGFPSDVREDYDKIFPLSGLNIERAEKALEDLPCRTCDATLALSEFDFSKYKPNGLMRSYTVTVTVVVEEVNSRDGESKDFESDIVVRYIGKNGSEELLCTMPRKHETESVVEEHDEDSKEEFKDTNVQSLKNGITSTAKFSVKSGYPLFLSVKGMGYPGVVVRASIKAVDDSGIISIPEISAEVNQPSPQPETIDSFCKYLILP